MRRLAPVTNAAFSNDFQRLRPVMVAFRDQVLPNLTEEMRLAELPKASLPPQADPRKEVAQAPLGQRDVDAGEPAMKGAITV